MRSLFRFHRFDSVARCTFITCPDCFRSLLPGLFLIVIIFTFKSFNFYYYDYESFSVKSEILSFTTSKLGISNNKMSFKLFSNEISYKSIDIWMLFNDSCPQIYAPKLSIINVKPLESHINHASDYAERKQLQRRKRDLEWGRGGGASDWIVFLISRPSPGRWSSGTRHRAQLFVTCRPLYSKLWSLCTPRWNYGVCRWRACSYLCLRKWNLKMMCSYIRRAVETEGGLIIGSGRVPAPFPFPYPCSGPWGRFPCSVFFVMDPEAWPDAGCPFLS